MEKIETNQNEPTIQEEANSVLSQMEQDANYVKSTILLQEPRSEE